MTSKQPAVETTYFTPHLEQFKAEIISGLQKPQKELPSKYFYDEKGAYLFERICSLDEYYIPSTEEAIMEDCIGELTDLIGPRSFLLEYGAGNCKKVRLLLDNLNAPVAYTPIDISTKQLKCTSQTLASDYPGLQVLPVCADYTNSFTMPKPKRAWGRKVVFFPGSTISNFDPVPAKNFLQHIAALCKPNGALVIGVDLKKDPAVLHRAYNDNQGVTAAFNLNLLARINRELHSDFDLESFRHYAFYNPRESRIEMHLLNMRKQNVNLSDVRITLAEGESIWTESSYKYNVNEFAQLAASAGFRLKQVWTDKKNWFSVQYLEII